MIPVRGPKNTAYPDIAEMNELAVCTGLIFGNSDGKMCKIHIEYLPWIDTNTNNCNDE